ncbi:MAG TPA: DedA family protein [Jiangellaceae bacterium]|nr:DedA family protein [Jiangellaceae bacterium]
MIDGIVEAAENAMGSPWIYVALLAIAAIDAFFPVVPSETLVISAGVFAASNASPNLLLVIVSSAAGAFIGDHISYFIGRFGGARLLTRAGEGSRSRRMFDWASRTLYKRGGLILVIARYIPGGRTATTMTCGTVGYPLRRFTFFDGIAALSWGAYAAVIGYAGGQAFEDDPVRGLLTGFGIAIGITVAVEVVRYLRERRSRASDVDHLPSADVVPAESDG